MYERLVRRFAHREVSKTDSQAAGDDPRVERELLILSVVAFGMFNRSAQWVTDAKVAEDLTALGIAQPVGQSVTAAHQRLAGEAKDALGRFFYIHRARTMLEGEVLGTYEFLHATFGEYLVAHYSVKVLNEVADHSRQARRGGREYDDDLLFALLSHQSLATRRSTLNFVVDLFARFPDRSKLSCAHALETLFQHYRNRASTPSYDTYQPLPADHVRKLAAYSSNIVLLLTLLNPDEGVDLEALAPSGQTDRRWWASTVELWRSGLEQSGWESLCRALDVNESGRVVPRLRPLLSGGLEIGFQQLRLNDRDLARYQWGMATDGWANVPGTGSAYSDLLAGMIYELHEDSRVSITAREKSVAAVSS